MPTGIPGRSTSTSTASTDLSGAGRTQTPMRTRSCGRWHLRWRRLTLLAAGISSSRSILRGLRRSSGSSGWPTKGARAFVRLFLLDEKAASIARFDSREDDSPRGRHDRRVVAAQGGSIFLAVMYDRLQEVLRLRPAAVLVRSQAGNVEETYSFLMSALMRPENPLRAPTAGRHPHSEDPVPGTGWDRPSRRCTACVRGRRPLARRAERHRSE
jgi:hypothetical protein